GLFAGSVWTGSFRCRKLTYAPPFVLGSSITIAEGRTWDWVREFPILRSRRLPDRLRAIVAENATSCVSIQSSEDCITSTHWRPRDPLSGSDSNFLRITASTATLGSAGNGVASGIGHRCMTNLVRLTQVAQIPGRLLQDDPVEVASQGEY